MSNIRLIARLDIKGPNLIKGIHLEGLRVIGDPNEHAVRYYKQGADELIYMDTVASLYGRNNLSHIIKQTAENVFIPITVGGGVRSTDDVKEILAVPLIGVIPESKAVLKASNTGTPVTMDDTSDASVAYQDAIARFLGEQRPMRFISNEKKGLLKRLFGKNKEGVSA